MQVEEAPDAAAELAPVQVAERESHQIEKAAEEVKRLRECPSRAGKSQSKMRSGLIDATFQ